MPAFDEFSSLPSRGGPAASAPLRACAVTSTVFLVTYWTANRLTDLRGDIGAAVFDWERGIPFVAWTIVPYLSICGFFLWSFFVGREPEAARRHVLRLMLVLWVSVACYAVFPLRFMFERPAAGGVFATPYAWLTAFDLPYNRAPSLHISVLVVLWVRFAPRLGRLGGLCLSGWFALIGVSVLTTYQHHVVDVLAGVVLAVTVIAVTSPRSAVSTAASAARHPVARSA